MSPKRRVRPMRPQMTTSAAAVRTPSPNVALQHRRRRRRRRIAIGLFVLGLLVAAFHPLEHLGLVRLFDPGMEDVLIGYPTAISLLIVGGILWG